MPNWLPESFPLLRDGVLREAGRLIWAIYATAVGTTFILAWMRPPLRRRLLTPLQGVVAYVALVVVGLGIYNLLAAATDDDGGWALLGVWLVVVTWPAVTVALILSRRPRPKGEVTWAMAILGATYVMAMFFLIYAIVPNEWIVFANSTLDWTKTNVYEGFPFDVLPFTWTGLVTNDLVATLIYVVALGGTMLVAKKWQARPDPVAALAEAEEGAAEEELKVVGKSRFGRPVRAKA